MYARALALLWVIMSLPLLASSAPAEHDRSRPLLVGDPAPELSAIDWVRGLPTTRWQSGRVYVIDFWAPWCAPCIEGFSQMQALQERYTTSGVVVVGVAIWARSAAQSPEAVLERFPDLTYRLAVDRDDSAARAFMDATRSSGVPCAMIIDRDGRLAWVGSVEDGLEPALLSVVEGRHDIVEARDRDRVRHEAAAFVDQAASAEQAGRFHAALTAIDQAIAVDPDRFSSYRGWQYEIALLRLNDPDLAASIATELLNSPQGEDPYNLFVLASRIVHNHDHTPPHLRDLDLALRCAQGAVAGCAEPNERYLNLLARVQELRRESTPAGAASSYPDAAEAFLAPYVGSKNFSGTVLVVQGERVLLRRGFGLANREHQVPNSPETKYQIASISKTFTVAAVLLLRDRGELRLDDPVSRFLPDFPGGDGITVRQLLDHTSGLPRFVFQPDYRERSLRPHNVADLVDWIRDVPPVAEPGQKYGYSNANFALLARIVELKSGMTFPDFVEHDILTPLDLRSTGSAGQGRAIIRNRAMGYVPVGSDGLENSRYFDYSVTTGSGAMYSTVDDLLAWFRSLRAGDLLTDASRAAMFGEAGESQGLGWHETEVLGRPALRANGWDGVGFASYFLFLPAEDLIVIALCNLNISAIAREIAVGLAGLALSEEAATLEFAGRQIEETSATEAAGVYRFGPDFYVPDSSLEIRAEAGGLVVSGDPEGALLPLSRDAFIHRQHWFRITLVRDEQAVVTGMRYGAFDAVKESEISE